MAAQKILSMSKVLLPIQCFIICRHFYTWFSLTYKCKWKFKGLLMFHSVVGPTSFNLHCLSNSDQIPWKVLEKTDCSRSWKIINVRKNSWDCRESNLGQLGWEARLLALSQVTFDLGNGSLPNLQALGHTRWDPDPEIKGFHQFYFLPGFWIEGGGVIPFWNRENKAKKCQGWDFEF